MTLKYYLVFDDESTAIDIMSQVHDIIHRSWDTPNYNGWTEKWWTEDPHQANRFPQVWDITDPYRLEVDDDTWFSNPNPEDPPEYP